jgi:hypothetical protein
MRDVKADWKRWSEAERIIAIVAAVTFVVAGSSVFIATLVA